MNKRASTARRHARRATTLAELIVSLTITSIIALTIASMLFAAGYGTSSKRDMRHLVVQSERVRLRLNDALRSARAVLAPANGQTAAYVVLWQADTTGEGQVNLSELKFIDLLDDSSTLTSYVSVDPLGNDPTYDFASDFHAIATGARSAGDLVGTDWSNNVSDMVITMPDAVNAAKPLVQWRLTLTSELLDETLVDHVAMRSAATAE